MSKEERQARAAEKKKGVNVTVLVQDEDASDTYRVVATQSEGIRTEADLEEWMIENDTIGTFYPVRFGKAKTREKQEIMKIRDGE